MNRQQRRIWFREEHKYWHAAVPAHKGIREAIRRWSNLWDKVPYEVVEINNLDGVVEGKEGV